ncbi:MAG: SUMF1/EgtB/PvdO family nonheme iron enzyme, partial [Elusimicrobiota bacterium]
EQGYAPAQTQLADLYRQGRGVAQEDGQAVSWLRKAAEQGYAPAQADLAWMYNEGRGVSKDYEAGASWNLKAAGQNYGPAQFGLGQMYFQGQGVVKNEEAAASWYRKAAEGGSAAAEQQLGWMYASGRGLAENDVEAASWYRQAARQGLAEAQLQLGSMYEQGQGVERSDAEAMAWYRKAAEQGLALAQLFLGRMCEGVQGGGRDEEAALWYRKAAEHGLAEAQVHLGTLYALGRGVAKSGIEAMFWYRKAAEQGDVEAQDRLGRISDSRPDAMIADASPAGIFRPAGVPEMPPPQAPPDVDVSTAAAADFRGLDVASLAAYNAAFVLDQSPEATPPQKAESWRRLGRDFPKYAQSAAGRAAQWDAYDREFAAAREADWRKLEHFLNLEVVPEREKMRWSAEFLRDYWAWPGVEPATAHELAAHVEEGAMRDALAALEPKGKGGIQWVRIPPGSYTMGSEADSSWTRPRHRVTLKSFELSQTLVTNKQYKACVADGACSPAHLSDGKCEVWGSAANDWILGGVPDSFQGDEQPAVCVDWNQAKIFSEWAGGRLPSEAEWEYAARSAGNDWNFPWGNEDATCERAMVRGCGDEAPAPVCSKTAGNTLQGLCDMAGNAWEWVQDSYHESYAGAPADGSAWEVSGLDHVFRGGSFLNPPGLARTTSRRRGLADYSGETLGFRIARSVRATARTGRSTR